MREYIFSFIVIFLGVALLSVGVIIASLNYNALISAFGSTGNFIQFAVFYIAIDIAIIIFGIAMFRKSSDQEKRYNRLDTYGERVIGVVKSITINPKVSSLAKVDVEAIISSKGTKHTFTSDWFDYSRFHVSKGVKLYVIYDKKNISNYSVVYNKIIRD